MSKEVKEAKKKIEMLTNHLLDSIDVDLLSDSQKIAYLKAIQPFVMPRLEAKMRSVLMLTQDDSDESLRHLCIVKNNYLPEAEKSMSYVLRFNEHLAFNITSDRVKLNELALEDWIEDAKKMKEDGMSYREISDKLLKKGFTVSKSKLQRKLN